VANIFSVQNSYLESKISTPATQTYVSFPHMQTSKWKLLSRQLWTSKN